MKQLLDPQEVLEILAASPGKIASAVSGLTDTQLALRVDSDEWSPLEVLAHLRACADVWGDVRIARMLAEDEPTIRAVNPRGWIRETSYTEIQFRTSLEAFSEQRQALLTRLRACVLPDWERGATVTGGGAARRYTVHTEADAIARHERAHIKQVESRCRLLREHSRQPAFCEG